MKGIVLLAVGKPNYFYFAFNMALSIKFHSNIPIQFICDDNKYLSLWHMEVFDIVSLMDKNDYEVNNKLAPGKAKLSIYKYLEFDENIYLDVDGIALKPLEPLFDECQGFYQSQLMGKEFGVKGDEKWEDMVWAYPRDIWRKYKLDADAKFPFINSSFQYVKKCAEAESLYKLALKNINNPIPVDRLRSKWSLDKTEAGQPDELYMNIALTQLGLIPQSMSPIYFSNMPCETEEYLTNNHYVLGLFGNTRRHTHESILYYYDRKVHYYSKHKFSRNIEFKSHRLMEDKYMMMK